MKAPAWLAGAALVAAAATVFAAERSVDEIVAWHLAARGGAARWRGLESLEMTGTYAAFSYRHPFRLIRKRGDLYRLDFTLLGAPAVRARDRSGAWGQHKLLQPEPGRLSEGPYRRQHERESVFGPLLLDYRRKGIAVELLGAGEVDGRPTVDLQLTFPDGQQEVWHLDAESGLEVAVDSQVHDFTQAAEPMRQRAFFDDFREVGGLVLPFQVDLEFGARLEAMTVEEVFLDPPLDDDAFALPAAPGAGPTEPEAERGAGRARAAGQRRERAAARG